MHIDQILDAADAGECTPIGADWGQGRTLFGGLSAAILCRWLQRDVPPERRLRSLEIAFARPFMAEQPYRVEIEPLTEGRNLTMCAARLWQQDKLCVQARADFIRSLDSAVVIDHFVLPAMAPPEASPPMKGGALPAFFSHFDARLGTAALPFSGASIDELGGYMRFAVAPRELSDAHLVCLVDTWPPTASTRYRGVKPLSTIGWTLHFADSVKSVAADGLLGYHSQVHFGIAGISSTSADIWAPDGRLLARSTQNNIVYG